MNVIISPNIKRQRTFVNVNGDEVKPYTKEVIKSSNEGNYVPTQEERELVTKHANGEEIVVPTPIENKPMTPESPLTIQQQIDEAKLNLAKLEELKKIKIQEMKAQLELLESE